MAGRPTARRTRLRFKRSSTSSGDEGTVVSDTEIRYEWQMSGQFPGNDFTIQRHDHAGAGAGVEGLLRRERFMGRRQALGQWSLIDQQGWSCRGKLKQRCDRRVMSTQFRGQCPHFTN
jgi:hypothetical protein